MNTNKYIQLIALWAITLMGLTSCDKEGVLVEEVTGYTTVSAKIDFQADKDRTYKMVVDGNEIKEGEKLFLPRTGGKVLFEVFRDNETTPELQEEIELENGGIISLVQLPESKISLAGVGSTEEEDPKTRNSIKARFFYAQQDFGKSIKVDVFVYDASDFEMKWIPLTSFTVQQGKISDYIEFDLAMFYEPGEGIAGDHMPTFSCDITNMDNGEKILNHENFVTIEYQDPMNWMSADENGDRSAYKFATFELQDFGYGTFMFMPVFGIHWEDVKQAQ